MKLGKKVITILLILVMTTMNIGTSVAYAEIDEETTTEEKEPDQKASSRLEKDEEIKEDVQEDTVSEEESISGEKTLSENNSEDEEKKVEEAEIEDGVYKIQVGGNRNFVLDVSGGNTEDGANIQIYINNETDAQKWYVTKQEDGWYQIKSVQSGKLLSSASKNGKSVENINQNSLDETMGQKYKFYRTESGSYYIASESGNVLDIAYGEIANLSNVQLHESNETATQQWYLEKTRSSLGEDAEKQIEDGYYTINIDSTSNLGFDIVNYTISNGGNLQLWNQTPNAAQIFYINKNADGWYTIKNFASGKVLDVSSGKSADGTNVQQWDANGTNAQKFKFYEDAKGIVHILSALGKRKVLDISGGNMKNGGNVQIYTYNGSNAQNFVIKSWNAPGAYSAIDGGNYRIYPAGAPRMSMDVQNASKVNGGNIQIFSDNSTGAQEWKVIPNGDWYYLQNVNSGKVLDIQNGSGSSGVNLQQWSPNGGAGQLFRFYKNENGYYIMAKTGRVVDCTGGNLNNGTNLQIYAFNGSAAQQWKMEKVLLSVTQIANITDGYYLIKSGEMCMEVANASEEDRANVGLGTVNKGDYQVFKVTNKGNSWCEIKNLNSGKVLDVTNGDSAENTNLQQFEANGSVAQRFRFYVAQDGKYYIKSQLGTMITSDAENANTYLGKTVLSNEQKWQIERVVPEKTEVNIANGNYRIFSALESRMVLDISNASRDNGANVQLWTDNGTMAQSFYICKENDGWYSIKNNNSGKYLDVDNGSSAAKTNLKQWQKNGSNAQKFKFYDSGDGKMLIRSKLGTYVDVANGKCYNGANAWLYAMNGSNAQIWQLKKAYAKQTLDSVLGISGGTIQEELLAHANDRYYLGTRYCGDYTVSDRCMHPNGSPGYNNYTGLNCTGFIAFVVGKCGGDLGKVAGMGRAGGYTNGSNWYKYLQSVNVECYAYSSIAEFLRDGRAEKGDIMYKEPKYWNRGEDCHFAFFWGDTAWDNRFWQSVESGNQISPLEVENYTNTYYLIKTRK